MTDPAAILAAHIQFELERFTPEGFARTIAEETRSLFTWLETVTLADVAGDVSVERIRQYTRTIAVTEEAGELIADLLREIHAAALADETLLGDLVEPQTYDRIARIVVGLEDARKVAIEQVTTSEAYSRLMSHVMYQGIKNYLQAENVVARKVPGASALMRMGQSAINTAAPKLEKAIDERLTNFVNSNISDSIRDSQRYLNKALDSDLLMAVADEFWEMNAKSTVGEFAALIPTEAVDEAVNAVSQAWRHLITVPMLEEAGVAMVKGFLAKHGDDSIASLLTAAGLSVDVTIDLIIDISGPTVETARDSGYLEERISARLAPFYADYFGTDAQSAN